MDLRLLPQRQQEESNMFWTRRLSGIASSSQPRYKSRIGQEVSPVPPGLPPDFARSIASITADSSQPSESEFKTLSLAPADWKQPIEWKALAEKYQTAGLNAFAQQLLSRANALAPDSAVMQQPEGEGLPMWAKIGIGVGITGLAAGGIVWFKRRG